MLGNLLDFAGGLMSQRQQNRQWNKSLAFEREKFGQAKHQFDQQMDASIQRRVKDAQAAGIHPLFALGASAGASPTLSAGSAPAPTGSAVGDAVSRIGERLALAEIRAKEKEAEKSEAEAALANSKAATIAQGAASQGRDGATMGPPSPDTFPGTDIVYGPTSQTPEYVLPQVKTSQSPGVATGDHPMWKNVSKPDGTTMQVLDDALQADELNQAFIAWDLTKDAAARLSRFIVSKPFWRGRNMDRFRQILDRRIKGEKAGAFRSNSGPGWTRGTIQRR